MAPVESVLRLQGHVHTIEKIGGGPLESYPPLGYEPYDFSPCPSSERVRFQMFVERRSQHCHNNPKSHPPISQNRTHRSLLTMATSAADSAAPDTQETAPLAANIIPHHNSTDSDAGGTNNAELANPNITVTAPKCKSPAAATANADSAAHDAPEATPVAAITFSIDNSTDSAAAGSNNAYFNTPQTMQHFLYPQWGQVLIWKQVGETSCLLPILRRSENTERERLLLLRATVGAGEAEEEIRPYKSNNQLSNVKT